MSSAQSSSSSREAVGYFDSAESLQQAIDELLSSGFNRAELSLLAAEDAVEKKLGHAYTKVQSLEDDLTVPRAVYVSDASMGAAEGALIGTPLYVAAVAAAGTVLVSGGTIAAAFAVAALAGTAGGLIGAVLATMLGAEHAQHIEEQLEHGGLLLWVRTWNAEEEKSALDILKRHSGRDVHLHELALG